MAAVKSGDTVHIHYTGTLLDGTVFDSSEGRDPLAFTVGAGQVIKGLDAVLPGMELGAQKKVSIPATDAYGPINPALRQDVPRSSIPADIRAEPGTQLQMQGPNGQIIPVTIVQVNDEAVTLDANHPLAGHDLTFDFTVEKID
ncbi:MAG: peptidylprolyl isomerase [Pseudomonadota bacterium]